jgi:DNA phosphorothioation-associated putative methyltransferase
MSQPHFQFPHKAVLGRYYVHLEGLALLSADAAAKLAAAEALAQVVRAERYNVARFESSSDRVSLLHYPGFFEEAFPTLHESRHADLTTRRVSYRTYRDSLTPPILHRKELMLPEGHPRRAEFEALTKTAEAIGLFQEPTRIGFREQWLRLVREKGYRIVGHEFVPIANDETTEPPCVQHFDGPRCHSRLTRGT